MAVDQTQVEGMKLDMIRDLTVGPEGSSCTLQMLRDHRYLRMHAYIHIYTWILYIWGFISRA